MPEDFRLILDGAKMAELLRSPTGPIGRMAIERATRVQAAARAQIAPHNRTGCLQGSVVKRMATLGTELMVRVVSDTTSCSASRTSYSLYVHEGTAPHDIPGAFGIPAPFGIGGQYSGKFHPGTVAIPFLRDNLHLAGD